MEKTFEIHWDDERAPITATELKRILIMYGVNSVREIAVEKGRYTPAES